MSYRNPHAEHRRLVGPLVIGVMLTMFVVTTLPTGVAEAKSRKVLDYSFDVIWSTTVRMLRVDRGYKITDKDRKNGYLLFVYPGSGSVKQCAASLEIFNYIDDQRFKRRRLQLSIAHQPSYVEVHLLDKLERKLFEDHGRPPAPRREKKPEDKTPGNKGNKDKAPADKAPADRG